MKNQIDYRKLDVVRRLLKVSAVKFRPEEPFTYTSGNKGPIYFDLRLLMGFPQDREIITLYYLDLIDEHIGTDNFDVVSGTATAGIPLAAWVVDKLRLPMIYVRGSQKDYGLKKAVEGVLEKGQRVLILEDIVNFGKSSIGNIQNVKKSGGLVCGCVSIADFEQQPAHESFAKEGVDLHAMVTVREVVEIAVELGNITKDQYDVTIDWLDQPEGWYERQGF